MARKKRSTRKRSSTKTSSSVSSRRTAGMPVGRRFTLAWKNMVFFIFLFLVSFIFYKVLSSILLQNFFGLIAAISGIVAAALLIAVIVLAILKSGRR